MQNRVWTQTDDSGLTATFYYADDSDNSVGVSNSDGTWSRNVTGIGGTLAAIQFSSGGVELELPDMQGSVGAQVDDSAGISFTDSVGAYRDFGLLDYDSGWNNPYGWKGAHLRSSNDIAGLTLMGQRLYNPGTGRFLQTDPVPGGSANNYDYANQDPINNNDYNGQRTNNANGHVCHWYYCDFRFSNSQAYILADKINEGAATVAFFAAAVGGLGGLVPGAILAMLSAWSWRDASKIQRLVDRYHTGIYVRVYFFGGGYIKQQ
jgi:RHS repeat-associated protein